MGTFYEVGLSLKTFSWKEKKDKINFDVSCSLFARVATYQSQLP